MQNKTPGWLGRGLRWAGRLFGLGQAKHAFRPRGILAGEKPAEQVVDGPSGLTREWDKVGLVPIPATGDGPPCSDKGLAVAPAIGGDHLQAIAYHREVDFGQPLGVGEPAGHLFGKPAQTKGDQFPRNGLHFVYAPLLGGQRRLVRELIRLLANIVADAPVETGPAFRPDPKLNAGGVHQRPAASAAVGGQQGAGWCVGVGHF